MSNSPETPPVHGKSQTDSSGGSPAARPRRGNAKAFKADEGSSIQNRQESVDSVSGSQDRLLTAAELALKVGFSVRRVREYAAVGKIPAVRLNRRDLRFHWPTVIKRLAGV